MTDTGADQVDPTPELLAVLAYYDAEKPTHWTESLTPALDVAVRLGLLTSADIYGKVTEAGRAVLAEHGPKVTVQRGRWYPAMPPPLPGETTDEYTNRLAGVLGEDLVPYDHPRNRQCSIGWHEECSDQPSGGTSCFCPCHPLGMPIEKGTN